jgi:hypothetical protein
VNTAPAFRAFGNVWFWAIAVLLLLAHIAAWKLLLSGH